MRLILLGSVVLFGCVVAPPPNRGAGGPPPVENSTPPPYQGNAAAGENQQQPPPPQKPLYEFTYSKYLEEVVKVLESDPIFNEKLRNTPEEDIKTGNIAEHVDQLPDPVLDHLHKLKFAELERLRETIAKQVEADGGPHNVKLPEHLDLQNWEKFNKEDLRKLIKQTVADMEEIDKQRKVDFKEYELKKKAEEDHKFAQMPPEEREKAKHEAEEAHQRHNDHEKIVHPGSRDQLEKVWEESDQMEKDNFDPRTFFALHDLNGDGFWNSEELEALFQIELEKMYNETNPEDDPRERMEEMYRMREHVVKQMDKNEDRMISLEEFMQDTEAQTPNKDPGWEDLGEQIDHNKVYTDEELRKFEEEYAKQMGQQQPIQPAGVNRGGVPDGNHNAGGNPPPVQVQPAQGHPQPPAPPVQPNAGHQQQAQQPAAAQQVNQQQQQVVQNNQPPPQAHAPIHDIPKDPSYGI